MLDITRQDLRDYLNSIGQDWIEDPSNKSEKFDRVKMRNAMPVLAGLGLTTRRLAGTAKGLQPARAALKQMTLETAQVCCKPDKFGTVAIDLEILQAKPLDIQYRVVSHAMGWVSGAVYRPRFSALKSVYELLRQGKSQTLAGCYIKAVPPKQVIVMRELANMVSVPVSAGCFDGRWRVIADALVMDADSRPLGGNGLMQLKNWRDLGVKRDILLQTPAAWQDRVVISAPLAGFDGPVQFDLKIDARNSFWLSFHIE
jgi:tRNA(Ile)-lysidine synthase